MWTWRRMLKISWTWTVTNKEVLIRSTETRRILRKIWHRKHKWFDMDIIKWKVMCNV